jgi:hypothetical protein
MVDRPDSRPDCAEIRELLPELAAGVAAGDDRARVLAHLGGCVDCRRELDAMAAVVDDLLTLVPAVPPPDGFESAVLAKVAPPRRRWWRGRALRLAATMLLAATVGAVASASVAMRATADDRRVAESYRKTLQIAGGRYLTARPINAPDGFKAGRVFAYQGTPSWVFLVIEYDKAAGSYEVEIVTRDGQDQRIGAIEVTNGEGSWGTAIRVDIAQIAEVRLSGPAGPPLTAGFH